MGVAADHVFGEGLQQVLDDRFLAGGDVGLAPAVDAAFGFDAAEQSRFLAVPGSNRNVSMRAIFMDWPF
jgi:hypothetical protein